MVGLKKIAQQLLVFSEPSKYRDGLPELSAEGEIQRLHFGALPLLAGRAHHVYLTPSDMTFEVRTTLRQLFARNDTQCSISAANLEAGASTQDERQQAITSSCAVVMPLNASIMLDEQVHSDLRFAQQSGVKVIMLHMHQTTEGPEESTFTQIMGNCPSDISGWLFDELAVDWHLDEDFKPVGEQLVWQRLAALCNGDTEVQQVTSKKRGSVGRGTLPPAQKEEQPIQAKEVELELTLTDKVD